MWISRKHQKRTVTDRVKAEIDEASDETQGAVRSFFAWLNSPTFLARFHGYATLVWVLLMIPSLLLWKESLLWVIIMSVWANVAGHWSSWQASRAERQLERQKDQ